MKIYNIYEEGFCIMEGSARLGILELLLGRRFLMLARITLRKLDVAKSMLTMMGMSMQAIGVIAGSQHLQRHSVRSAEMEVLS